MTPILRTALLTLALAFPAVPAFGQESVEPATDRAEPLPTPQAVVDRYIEFSGGRKAFTDIRPTTATGSFSVPSAQLTGRMTTWTAPPNLMRIDIEIPGLGVTKTGFDGTVGWTLDPARGPSLMDGAMLEQIRREADGKSILDIFGQFDSVKVTGREEMEGADCVVLRLEKNGLVEERLFEEETGRLVATRSRMQTPMGEIPSTAVVTDWKKVGGRAVPSRTVIKMLGMEQVMSIDTVEEKPIEASVFALPPAIQALVKARDEKKAKDASSSTDGETSTSTSKSGDSSSSSSSSSSKSSESSSSKSSDSSSSKSSDSSSSKSSESSSSKSGRSSSSSSGGGR